MRAKRITINLKDRTYQVLRELCEETGESMSQTVCGLVEAAEDVMVRLTAFHRMTREAQSTWKEKTKANLEEVQEDLEPILAKMLRILGEGADAGERPQLRAAPSRKAREGSQPPYSNTGVRSIRGRGKGEGAGGVS